MTDAALVGRILREYRLGPATVRRRYGSASGPQVGYQLRRPGGAVLVGAYRADLPLAPHLRGAGTAPVTDWLLGRAATLNWLAARGYPAPRVVATRTGDPVGVAGAWLTWATSDVAGRALASGGGQAGLLGSALGRLHALGVPWPEGAPWPEAAWPEGAPSPEAAPGVASWPGLASWYPATAIPVALRRLGAVATLLPGEWRPLHEQFRRTLLAVQQAAAALPVAVVHGDPRPGNAVVTADGRITLIDWENGGLGLPVVDLGHCLLQCHLDPGPPGDRPGAWPIRPDPRRIAAVLDGYTRWRRLSAAELAILPEGIRFGAAYAGAIHFERALIDGVRGATMDARLGRLRNRVAVSQAVADLAARHLGER